MSIRLLIVLLLAAMAAEASDLFIPTREQGFTKDRLLRSSSLQLANPNGFHMQQSYSLQYTSSSLGSMSSGLYLNTLSYKFNIPLTLSVDVGVYNLLYAQSPFANATPSDTKAELLIPRIALEYKPTQNTLLSIQLFRGNDAIKAYGLYPYSSYSHANWLADR